VCSEGREEIGEERSIGGHTVSLPGYLEDLARWYRQIVTAAELSEAL